MTMKLKDFTSSYYNETGLRAKINGCYTDQFVKWLIVEWNKLDKEYDEYVNENPIL